jgi:hypothetical protein
MSCKYLIDEEDYWQTTIYKKCSCNMRWCSDYKGYCPIRDRQKDIFINK